VGSERWISEIFRLRTPEDMMAGMSTAQWTSIVAVLFGAWLLVNRRHAPGTRA
jgi:prolipoprotein diacylglyceryltransferase